jgi:hypothetical protein
MNNFTKEELKKMQEIMMDYKALVISCHREQTNKLLIGFISLEGKIQSMLDNACKHTSEVYECMTCHTHECSKCGEYWR